MKLVVTEFLSLDGVFEAPGPEGIGYKYEGWTFPYSNDEFMKFKTAELEAAEVMLLGRITYEGFAKAWPQRKGDPFSDKFNSMPKYVVSKSLKSADWENSHIIRSNFKGEIQKLKDNPPAGGGGDINVHGSGTLVRFLTENNLVDQFNLLMYPVILGTGKRLFENLKEMKNLKLIESQTFATGVVALKYELDKEREKK
jgi:dihydrofolate reductase